jgi:hypothetical protein
MTINGTYDLVVDEAWQYVNTDEFRIDCDTSLAPVIINLPEIADLLTEKEIKLVKLFIVDASGNAATNTITINPGGTNTIIGESPLIIDVNGGGVNLQIGNISNWIEYGDVPTAVLEEYDSGWKSLIAYDALKGYGFAANGQYPNIRIINRTVYLEGNIGLPLANAGVLIPNAANYPAEPFNELYGGVDGGFITSNQGSAISQSPIVPSTLFPYISQSAQSNIALIRRIIYLSDATTKYPIVTAILSSPFVATNGKLIFNGMKYIESDNLNALFPFSNLRNAISKFNAGDIAIDYSAYRNSYDAGGVIQQIPTNSGLTFPIGFDPSDISQYGGFNVGISMSYLLDPATSLADIKAAFDAI